MSVTMMKPRNVLALPAGSPVARAQARGQALAAELASVQDRLSERRVRRGELILDGKLTDKIDAEIDALISKGRSLQDAIIANDGRLKRAAAEESSAAVEGYNERLAERLAQLKGLADRWEKACNEAGLIAGEVLALLDSITELGAPHKSFADFASLRRMPASMITQLGVAICPPEEPMGRAPFRNALPSLPSYEMALEFMRRNTPGHLLNEARLTLERAWPGDVPPEAA